MFKSTTGTLATTSVKAKVLFILQRQRLGSSVLLGKVHTSCETQSKSYFTKS